MHRCPCLLRVGLAVSLAAATAAMAAEPPRELRFADFFVSPIGPRGLQPTPTLLAAAGQRVRITGFMVAQEQPQPGRFFLAPLPLVMSEHADGEADDLPPSTVVVIMPLAERAITLPHTRGLLQLTGTLKLGREELDDGRVSWLRLLLEPAVGITPEPETSNKQP